MLAPSKRRAHRCDISTNLIAFLAGCALASMERYVATVPIVFHPKLDMASKQNDNSAWKFVAMYRGGPRAPGLDADFASQFGQDRTIADIFRNKRNGTFLDLAANDAIAWSNTVTLEQKYDWNGLCVEPNPVYANGYLHRRCLLVQAVVGPKEDLKIEFNFKSNAWGGIVGFDNHDTNATESHYTVSVEKILRDFGMPHVIDYLSLDIEGAEDWAFEHFPWVKYTFLAITVERPKVALKTMLAKQKYTYLCKHGWFGDELWIHSSLQNFAEVWKRYGGREKCR